jgi:hypothetical protein
LRAQRHDRFGQDAAAGLGKADPLGSGRPGVGKQPVKRFFDSQQGHCGQLSVAR